MTTTATMITIHELDPDNWSFACPSTLQSQCPNTNQLLTRTAGNALTNYLKRTKSVIVELERDISCHPVYFPDVAPTYY